MTKTPNSLSDLKKILADQGYDTKLFTGLSLTYVNSCIITLCQDEWIISYNDEVLVTDTTQVVNEVIHIIGYK